MRWRRSAKRQGSAITFSFWHRRECCGQPRLDAIPHCGWRDDRADTASQSAKPSLPEGNLRSKARLACDAKLGLTPLLGSQHTEHILCRGEIAVLAGTYCVFIAHRSRHALSFNSPRLIQLFMVPSGTLAFSANCS